MPVASEARRLRWRRGRGRTRGGPTIAPSAQHADAQRPLTSPMSSYYESGMAPARHSQEMKSEAREMVATSASWLASGIRLPRGGRRVAGSKSPAAEVAPAPGTTTNGTSTNTPLDVASGRPGPTSHLRSGFGIHASSQYTSVHCSAGSSLCGPYTSHRVPVVRRP